MLISLVRFAAPLVLLTVLFFVTGAVSASVDVPQEVHADFCCDPTEASQHSGLEGEAVDPNGSHPSSEDSTLFFLSFSPLSSLENSLYGGSLAPAVSSSHIASIDYPPELTRI